MKNKRLKQIIQTDQISGPAPDVKQRLDHAFMARSASYPVRQNSFSGLFTWLFSLQGLGVKTTIAAFCLGFFLMNNNFDISSGTTFPLDSIHVSQSIEIDSSLIIPSTHSVNDSVVL